MVSPTSSAPLDDPSPEPYWVLPCRDLDRAVEWFAAQGYRLHSLGPADDPRYAVVELADGATGRIRLDVEAHRRGVSAPYLEFAGDRPWTEPDGDLFPTRSVWVSRGKLAADGGAIDSSGRLVFGGIDDEDWIVGRAGMRYRDLLPGRWDNRFIASHIHIPVGGPVPDYVHYHHVDFQLIFCHRGWVRVVYQDQGDPFVLEPGDAILQAPGIRHRVLEASDDLFVVEISSPAEHQTFAEHNLDLPNSSAPGKRYGGQDYVHFRIATADWNGGGSKTARRCELGVEAATDGRYRVELIELAPDPGEAESVSLAHDGELQLNVVLDGEIQVSDGPSTESSLGPGACAAVGSNSTTTATSTVASTILRVSAR